MPSGCSRGGIHETLGKASHKGLSVIGAGCSGKWFTHHPWTCLKDMLMRFLGRWFKGELGSDRLMFALNDLESLFHPKQLFYDTYKTKQNTKNPNKQKTHHQTNKQKTADINLLILSLKQVHLWWEDCSLGITFFSMEWKFSWLCGHCFINKLLEVVELVYISPVSGMSLHRQ